MTQHRDVFEETGEPTWEEQQATPTNEAPVEPSEVPEKKPLTPADRLKFPAEDRLIGWDFQVDGHTWMIPYDAGFPDLDSHRNSFYDAKATSQNVSLFKMIECLAYLLSMRYELESSEAISIFLRAPTEEVVKAVDGCLFGVGVERTYTDWMISGLVSAGLDPCNLPPDVIHNVLMHLQMTKRIAPPEDFVDSATQVARFGGLLSMLRGQERQK